MSRTGKGLRSALSKYTPKGIKRLRRHVQDRRRLRDCRKQYAPPFGNPFVRISIETRTDCNLKCAFCPQSIQPRPHQVMPDDLFRKIIDDLSERQFAGRICPLVNNEPLLDGRIATFIEYARRKCPLSSVELITNGRLLDEQLLYELFRAGLDSLLINDYRSDRDRHPDRLSRNLVRIAELSRSTFREKIRFAFRSTREVLSTRAGNMGGGPNGLPRNSFCALPFTGMWIQPEGKATLCCQDYGYDQIMGDVKKDSLSEIWGNSTYERVRRELWEGERRGKICEKCDYSGLPLAVAGEARDIL